jgi:protein-disulfide isomerase
MPLARPPLLLLAGAALFGAAAAAVTVAAPWQPAAPEPAARNFTPIVLAQAEPEELRAGAPDPAPSSFSDEQRDEIDRMIRDYLSQNRDFVRDYLIENPEVIQEAIAELERKQREQQLAEQQLALDANRDLLLHSPRQVVLGNPDGDVTLVEFFDYNCTYCKRSLADVDQLIADDPNLRVVLKEFPVLGPGSIEAAQVAVAVNMVAPEKYGEFHDLLLGSRAPADKARALAVAEEVGIDLAALEAQMTDEETVNATVNENYTLANALGLNGTPSYVIGDQVVVGAVGYDALKQSIDAARAACAEVSC